jgi:hypothetical protein
VCVPLPPLMWDLKNITLWLEKSGLYNSKFAL